MKSLFWTSLFIIFYTFVGYGILLYILILIRRIFKGKREAPPTSAGELPSCTLVVAAYNEEGYIRNKIENTLALKYPAGKLRIIFITDGSTDSTPVILAKFPQVHLLHQPERKGKIAAIHRAMEFVNSDVVVFTDSNTFLNTDALLYICRHYSDPAIGAVAGEKRILTTGEADAATAGEGFYWKYESTLKRWDSELHSAMGAAGELFSVRTDLYQPVSADAILDDFMISMRIAQEGYRVTYEPDAYAVETASQNVSEELKRKVRIAAGGIQSIIWLKALLNIFKYRTLSFQYISHRVLRWTVTPFLLILVFALNIGLSAQDGSILYNALLAGQLLFYSLAFAGFLLETRQLRVKVFFIPYYFCVMNYAIGAGIIRFCRGKQSASWEKSRRK
ncbi:glycosyltransferase family 2 protein [Arcticibacter sp. MXS-1]|uniref:glycosyltransferase family 2 protein n=1 Tax=Arcticibacter sp. MXS-1 TaxID=3341726 RepID=UPI0035A99B39